MADYRNISALIAAVMLLQLAGGVLGLITPLGLNSLGAGTAAIGLIAALHAAGFMLGAWFGTDAIRTFGNIRVHAAAGSVMVITILGMHLAPDAYAWSAIRILQGASLAMMFASIEAWLGDALPNERRGAVSSFYHLMAKVALIVGPFFAAGMAAIDPKPYMWAAIFMALSMLPICLTRREQPPVPDTDPFPIDKLFRLAPSAVFACFMAGVVNSGLLSLLPIYAVEELGALGMASTSIAAITAAVAWIGGLISQWPAGKISDRLDRRVVIAAMVGVSAIAAIILALVPLPPTAKLVLIGVWGAGSLSFYGIAVAHVIDWTPPGKIAQAMTGLLFVWAGGSVIGPIIFGLVSRTTMGTDGLFLLAGGLSLVLVLVTLFRRLSRPAPPTATQEPWSLTSPLLAAKGEVDPRVG